MKTINWVLNTELLSGKSKKQGSRAGVSKYATARKTIYALVVLMVMLGPASHSALADTQLWPWVSSVPGVWVLNDQTITVAPNTQVCVVPPMVGATPFVPFPVYQAVSITELGGPSPRPPWEFGETNDPGEVPQCVTVSEFTTSVIIHCLTSLTVNKFRDGTIAYHTVQPPVDCQCSTCSECVNELNSPSCNTVVLTADITDQVGGCINNPPNYKTFDCQGHTIDGNASYDGSYDYGVTLYGRSGITIRNCVIKEFHIGIGTVFSNNNIFENNTTKYNDGGINLQNSANSNTLQNNIADFNNYSGIVVLGDYNILAGNTAMSNFLNDGIKIFGSNNYLTKNSANSNYGQGIVVQGVENTIVGNTANSNGLYGVVIQYSENNTLNANTACGNGSTLGDIVSFGDSGSAGDNNQCDSKDNEYQWNDAGTTGCTHPCTPIVMQPQDPDITITESGNTNVSVNADTDPSDGKIGVSVSAGVYAYGSAGSTDVAEGIANAVLPFTVDQETELYLNVSIGGLMGGAPDYSFVSRINATATVEKDGVPVVNYPGFYEQITTRPLPDGFLEVRDEMSILLDSPLEPGDYTLEFSESLFASATGAGSLGWANFGGSAKAMISDRPLTEFPVADAGDDQMVLQGANVQLDGSGSYDPADNTLSFEWIQVAGDMVPMLNSYTPNPAFEATALGLYSFELVVSNGLFESFPDRVNVIVEALMEVDCFDGNDNDGDGQTDCADSDCEGAIDGPCDTGQFGICATGTLACSAGTEVCVADNQPQQEGPIGNPTCSDVLDNDCDGLMDEQDPNCQSAMIAILVDVKPGSDPNSINCNNENEVITVAILTTGDFDATTVDHTTVTFEGASEIHVDNKSGEPRRHEEDVDGDGSIDLVFHFLLGQTDLTCDSAEGTLTGETFDGQAIEGTDSVRMVEGGGA